MTIVAGQLTGHYFTVSSPFNFWDNNTIRYSGAGSDLTSESGISLDEVTLEYIINNIPEPEATTNTYYVATNGSDSNNGTSEDTPFLTILKALRTARAGSTIWVKAGLYRTYEHGSFGFSGTATSPIKLKGYKNTIGDLDGVMYYSFTDGVALDPLDPSEMPLMDGFNLRKYGLWSQDKDYLIIKNMQFQRYSRGFSSSGIANIIENCVFKEFYGDGVRHVDGAGITMAVVKRAGEDFLKPAYYRVKNTLVMNAGQSNLSLHGSNSLIENVKTYCDDERRGAYSTDYYIALGGSNSIVRNSSSIRKSNNILHTGHGIGVRGLTAPSIVYHPSYGAKYQYNLIEKNYSKGMNECYFARNTGSDFNVFKDNEATGFGGNSSTHGIAMAFMSDVQNNLVERLYAHDMGVGIRISGGTESGRGSDSYLSINSNIVRNSLFDKIAEMIFIYNAQSSVAIDVHDNKIYNNTFNQGKTFCRVQTPNSLNFDDNEFRNNSVSNVTSLSRRITDTPFNIVFDIVDHSNFYGGFQMPSYATNSLEEPPLYVDASNGDFHLNFNSTIKDAGIDLPGFVDYDMDRVQRSSGKYSIGAFDDAVPRIGSVVPDVDICLGESTTLIASGGVDYSWSTGETSESITVSPTETTTYTVDISDGTNTDSHEVIVNVSEPPTVDAGPDITICSDETIVLTATGVGNFLWSTGETTESITVSPTATTRYTVTASNACNTDATDEVLVTVNPAVVLDAGVDVEMCVGENIVLTAISNGDYLWSTGETTPSITVSPSSTTIYTVTSFLGGCSKTDEVEVQVNDVPTVDAGADVEICSDETIVLTATGIGDFLWSTGETTASITVNPSMTTTYTVTSSNSCSTDVTDQVIVTVNPAVELDAGLDVGICAGESITLTATSNGDFLWSTGETTASITVSPSSTEIYTITSTLGGCSKTDEVEVLVSELPTVNAGDDVTICTDEYITLTASGIGDFLWSTGETSPSITVNPSSTTTYSVTASNSCSTSATDEVVVTVNDAVILDAGIDVEICSGESITLTATSNGDFLWSTGETTQSITVNPLETTTYSVTSSIGGICAETDEVIVTVNELEPLDAGYDVSICSGESVILTAAGDGSFLWSTGETSRSITVSPTSTTAYTVSLNNSCTTNETDEVIVTVNDAVTLDAGADVEICSGESITLTATSNGDYLWSTGETTSSITVSPSSNTVYTVSSSISGCSDVDSVEVIVNPSPSVSASPDITICSGESVILTATGSGNFLWSTGETSASITVSPSSTTSYTVTSNNSCSANASDEVVVTVNEAVTLNAGADIEICSGESVVLTATSNGNFLWNTGETSSSISVSPTTTTTYTVTSSLGDCSKVDQVKVTVRPSPSVNAGSDVAICIGENIILTASGIGNFEWSTGETTPSITVSPSSTTIYTVTSSTSCSTNVSDDVVVTVNVPAGLDAGVDAEICSGESITLTATGNGNFLWNTGETTASITVSPSSTTTYSVSSDVGVCSTMTDEVTITVHESAKVNLGADITICEGEEITLVANGTGSLLWSTGETGTSIIVSPSETTTYTITSSITGKCESSVTDTVTVNVNRTPVATANDDIIIESGSSIDLTVSGIGSFEWSTGEIGSRITVSPTETTTYIVTATTGEGCFINDEVVVTVVDEFEPTEHTVTAGQNATICTGDSVIIEAPTGTRYLWSSGQTERSISVTPSETTIYSVKVYNGESSETRHSTISVTDNCDELIALVASGSLELDQEINVYPNPTKGLLNVKLKGYNNDSRVSVYNLNGTMLYSRDIQNKAHASVLKEQLDLSKFPKGIYFVQLSNNGQSKTKKVIVM